MKFPQNFLAGAGGEMTGVCTALKGRGFDSHRGQAYF